MSASAEDAGPCLLTDLPEACLRGIVQCLWHDARDAAAFACCCSITRGVCDEQLLWRELLVQRYGERVIPGMKPSPEEARPAELGGFLFYQGWDGSEDTDVQHAAAGLAQLAKLTQDADAEAFTTSGKVVKCLKPQAAWRHSSFRPTEGMFVRKAAVQYRQLKEPQPAQDQADDAWPPSVPGWVYFPSCVSLGHFIDEPQAALARYATLQAVLHAAARPGQRQHIIAVTTEGETKGKLRPQACWEVHPSYDTGLYVRATAVQQMRLVPSPAVPDYRQLCSKLQQLRLDAAHMSCAWLNDQYLSLQETRDSPAGSGMALLLNSVWWLDVSGSIPGVPPGSYKVSWVMDVTHAHLDKLTLTAEAVPVHAKHQQQQQQDGAEPAASAATSAAAASEAVAAQADKQQGKVEVQQRWRPELQRLQQQCRMQGAAWGVVSGGVLSVSEYSTVQLRCSNTDSTFKQNVRWAMVELVPVKPQQQHQQQLPHVALHRNRVWRPPAQHAGRQGHGGAAENGDGGVAAGVAYARGLVGWLERMLVQPFQ